MPRRHRVSPHPRVTQGASRQGKSPGQDLWILATSEAEWARAEAALDACLAPDWEDLTDGAPEHVFQPWPSEGELLGAPIETDVPVPERNVSDSDVSPGDPPPAVEVGGRVVDVVTGGAGVTEALESTCAAVAVVEWRAPWTSASADFGAEVEGLAREFAGTLFLRCELRAVVSGTGVGGGDFVLCHLRSNVLSVSPLGIFFHRLHPDAPLPC